MHKPRANTVIWKYYGRSSGKDKIAKCNICQKVFSYRTTITNLKTHLKLKHISAYTLFLEQFGESGLAARSSPPAAVPVRPADSFLDGEPSTSTTAFPPGDFSVHGAAAERSEDFTNKLLQAVEKHPELYQGGSSAEEKDQHWIEIANELGERVRYCKEEWRCLRKLYQSYKGNQEDSTPEMEEQMEQMSFLAPYIGQEILSDSEPEDLENEIDDDDPLDNKSMIFETVTAPTRKQPLPAKRSRVESKNEAIDETPKKMFLLSLMPDIRQMNNEQMRKFKKGVLDLIDNVLNE